MANILFKRGTQASLDTFKNGGATDGVFYLTTDTNRLYVGNSDNNAVPVAETIIKVANFAALPKLPASGVPGSATLGTIYYDVADNILCIPNAEGNAWVQINPDTNDDTDTQTTDLTFTKEKDSTNHKIVVTATLKQETSNNKDENVTKLENVTGTFEIDQTDFSAVIDGAEVNIGSTIANEIVTLATGGTGSSNSSTVTIKGGDNVDLSGGDNEIIISVPADLSSAAGATTVILSKADEDKDTITFTADVDNWVEVSGTNENEIKYAHIEKTFTPGSSSETASTFTVIDSLSVEENHITGYSTKEITLPEYHKVSDVKVETAANGGLKVSVADTSAAENYHTGTLSEGLYYTLKVDGAETETKVYNQGYLGDFVSSATFKQYQKAADALVYKGTVASYDKLPTTNVSIGDTYKASAAFGDNTVNNERVYLGDLLIATGTAEDENGYITEGLEWTVVASGADTDTNYDLVLAGTSIQLTNTVDDNPDTINFVAGNDYIEITNNNGLSIGHKDDYTAYTKDNIPTAIAGTIDSNRQFNAVTSVLTDNGGHITGYGVSQFTLPKDTTYDLDAVKNKDNVIDIILQEVGEETNHKVMLTAGTDLTASVANNNITVAHTVYDEITAPSTTAAGELAYEGTLTVLTGVSVSNGHVTGLSTTSYTLPKSKHLTSLSYTSEKTTIEDIKNAVTLTLTARNNADENLVKGSHLVTSNSLTLVTNDTGYSIDLVWEEF